MRYGSSTWLTALQSESSSDKENKEESDHDCSDSSDECESQCMQVSTTAKFSSPEELYNVPELEACNTTRNESFCCSDLEYGANSSQKLERLLEN